MGPTPDAELHLRAARAEQQVADLNVERNVLDRNTTHRDLPKTYERERGSVSQSPRLEAVSVMAEPWSCKGDLSGQNRPPVVDAITCRIDRFDVHSN